MSLLQEIKKSLYETTDQLWSDLSIDLDLSASPARGEKLGDYSTPVALQISKKLGLNPLDIAEQIKEKLGSIDGVKQITVTPPGFVNFWVDFEYLTKAVLTEKSELNVEKSKIAIEHTSVNPNKAAHIGHLRNASLGDALARLLRSKGNSIEVQNYIDDLGLQVADSVLAFEQSGLKDLNEITEPIDVWMWHAYSDIAKKLEEDESLKERRDEILHEMESGSNPLAQQLVSQIVDTHRKTFEKFGIKYDLEVYEHDIINNNLWAQLFEDLKNKELVYQPQNGEYAGAWLVPFGNEEREHKILVRSNGLPTYTAKDLAYELWKFGKTPEMSGYEDRLKPVDKTITLIDERQTYPRQVIKETMIKLGYENEASNYHHLSYGVVKLSANALKQLGIEAKEDKASYSMSGRAGIGVMVHDLLNTAKKLQIDTYGSAEDIADNIAVGSIRYYMLKTRPEREIIFDFEEALKTDGNTGVYLQYAYARANNILSKAGINGSYSQVETNEQENELIKKLSEVSDALDFAAQELDPSLVCDYTYSLANTFAKFYETSPVLTVEDNLKGFRIKLVEKYLEVMGLCLEILGIPALPKI